MGKYMQFQPARFLAAMSALGQALIILCALVFDWSADMILAVQAVAVGLLAVFGSMFIEREAVSIAGLEAYADAVKLDAAQKAAAQRPGAGGPPPHG